MAKKLNYSSTITILSKFVSENKIIFLIIFCAFLLKFPTLFEPLQNNRESYLITQGAGLLPKDAVLPVIESPLVVFVRLAFFLFGQTFWSVKFLLLLYFLAALTLLLYFLKKFFGEKKTVPAGLLFALIFGLPYFGTNQVGLSLYFPPILIGALLLLNSRRLISRSKNHLLLFPLVTGFLMVFGGQSLPSASYYQNFLAYSASKITNDPSADERYLESFGSDIRQSYSLAFFVKRKTTAKAFIFVIGKQTAIYFLADRGAASKNISLKQFGKVDEILTDIETRKPVYILYDKKIDQLGELDRLLNKSYNLFAQENDVKIYFRKPI